MYGLEGILGNLVTSVATPAIGGLAGDFITKEVVDNTMPQLLKEMTQTTVGALSGAAVGAGLGAITGGRTGAISGALTGGVGGGLGGYHAPEISQMFGMNQTPPQGVGAPPPMQPQPQTQAQAQPSITDQLWKQNLLQRTQSPIEKASVGAVSPGGVGLGSADQASMFNTTAAQPVNQPITVPTQVPTAPTAPPSEYTGYVDFLKKNYEPLAGGFFLGSAYGANQDTQDQTTQNQQEDMLAELLKRQRNKRFSTATWGKAEGGPVEVGLANPQISVHFPAWAQEDIQREGGLAALQPGMKQGMANGGYVNTMPFDPQEFHPQSRIPSAQPYAGSAPTSVVNTIAHGASFGRGGLIDGPGDGQSDDIPANISGKEEVRVADGEYVIPKEIAAKYGPDKLKRMMTEVRKAAHAKKGAQIIQDAGKKAFIRSLSGVKA